MSKKTVRERDRDPKKRKRDILNEKDNGYAPLPEVLSKRVGKKAEQDLDDVIGLAEGGGDPASTQMALEQKFPAIKFNKNVRTEVMCALYFKFKMRNFTNDKIAEALGVSIATVSRLSRAMKDRMRQEVADITVSDAVASTIRVLKETQGQHMRFSSMASWPPSARIAALRAAAADQMNIIKTLYMVGFFDHGKFVPAQDEYDNDSDIGQLHKMILSMTDISEEDYEDGEIEIDATDIDFDDIDFAEPFDKENDDIPDSKLISALRI